MTQHTVSAPNVLPGLVLQDHEFKLPLDHAHPGAGEISVFAREVRRSTGDEKPWLVFLQGGPGFESPRPLDRSGWLARALEDYRVLLLDQRGTGRSTPVDAHLLEQLGAPDQYANVLRHFRADSIVRDAECIRALLTDGDQWSVLGQSFGGFCVTHYLSSAAHGLREALITGGLPPLAGHCDAVYARTYATLELKNQAYYERYPQDVERVHAIARVLTEEDVRLPSGDRLSPRRFRQLGLALGMSDGFEAIHYLVELAFAGGGASARLSLAFLRSFENALSYDTHPLFSVLHEACYAQQFATRWSAQRVLADCPAFEPSADAPLLFTGEMIYPWMFEEYGALAPLAQAANELAEYADWAPLYDSARLAANNVPCVAAIYANDMYVDRDFSLETATRIGNLRSWLTSEFEHNGLRADGARVLGHLLKLLHNEV